MKTLLNSNAARLVPLGAVLALAAGALLAWSALAQSAEPGSKDDPLATISYVQHYAQFTRHELAVGDSLRLGVGSEIIVVDPLVTTASFSGLDGLRDDLFNLTTGERATSGALYAGQHYVNGGTHDIFLKAGEAVPVLLRGEWKK